MHCLLFGIWKCKNVIVFENKLENGEVVKSFLLNGNYNVTYTFKQQCHYQIRNTQDVSFDI